MPKVIFYPAEKSVEVAEGSTVLVAAMRARATKVVCCGIHPVCGSCAMVVLEGAENLSEPDEPEQRHRAKHKFLDYQRLACHSHVFGPVVVELES